MSTGSTASGTDRVSPAASTDPGQDERWINRVFLMWHGAFAFLAGAVALNLHAAGVGRPAYAVLALLCAAYALLLVPSLRYDRPGRGYLYLVIAIPATLVLGYINVNGLTILYALFPQLFGLIRSGRRRWPLVVSLTTAAVMVATRHEDAGSALSQIGLALMISLMIGLFTQVILREAERRGALIAELETARADLDQAHHEAGVLTERQRLSHEIHDTLAQGFTSLLMLIQAADATVEKDPVTTHERLALAERTARDNLAEARALVAALAPAPLQDMPLDTAIGRVAARTGEELGITVDVLILGRPRELPADLQVVLLRATQESLSNVRKHAAAGTVRISFHYRDGGVLLEVADDGRGFPAGNARNSYGLRGMRARVEQVHGRLTVESAPGAGTTVRVEIP